MLREATVSVEEPMDATTGHDLTEPALASPRAASRDAPHGGEMPPPTAQVGVEEEAGHFPTDGARSREHDRSRRRGPRRRILGRISIVVVLTVLAGSAGFVGGWVYQQSRHDPTTIRASISPLERGSSTLARSGLNVASIIAAVEPSVVSVGTTFTVHQGPFNSVAQGAGTGIVLSSDGVVLTNAHVVASARSITVTLPGSNSALTADLVGQDTNADVAVIKIRNISGLVPAPLGDSGKVQVGDSVVAIGNALALEGGPSVTAGIISALNRSIQEDAGNSLKGPFQTDTAISSGNSGGPLVNAAGQVIGINTALAASSSTNTATNIGFAIPINTAFQIATRLQRG
jgi:S1-C subfamily serine protease